MGELERRALGIDRRYLSLGVLPVGFDPPGLLWVAHVAVHSPCRVESVVSQFRFLDSHVHLAWVHCLCGFLAYDGTWNWNGVPLGLIVGIFHWVSCLSALIHRGCFGSRTWQSIPPDQRPVRTVKVVEQQAAPAGPQQA